MRNWLVQLLREVISNGSIAVLTLESAGVGRSEVNSMNFILDTVIRSLK